MIDWENLFRIDISNLNVSMQLHEVVKLLLVMKLLNKHKVDRNYVRIYTAFSIKEEKRCDVYYENMKTKEVYAYEIQKKVSKSWVEKTKETYKEWAVPFMKTIDWVLIDLNKCPAEIPKINEWLNQFVR